MADTNPSPNKPVIPHPDDVDPVTWAQIDREIADYQTGKSRGYSVEELRVRHPRPQKNRKSDQTEKRAA